MSNLNKVKFSFLDYQKTFTWMGWASHLKPRATTTWFLLTTFLADLIEGIEVEEVEDGRFYYDFGYGTQDIAKEFGMSKATLSGAMEDLQEAGLIEIDEGRGGAGVSRIFFPISIPQPKEIKIPRHFKNRYNNSEDKLQRRIDFQNNMINPNKKKDYTKEDIAKYKLNFNDDQQTKRRKVQAQYLILLAKHNIDVNDKEVEKTERAKATQLIARFDKNPFLVEKVILRVYNIQDTLKNVYGVLVTELYKEKPNEKTKTKKHKAEVQKKLEQEEKQYAEVNNEFVENMKENIINNVSYKKEEVITTYKSKKQEQEEIDNLFGC